MEVGAIVTAACRAEGLDDLGPPDLEPLEQLVEAIRSEASLHPIGHLATHGRLVAALRNRLRAQAWFRRHPEILEQPVPAPIVITGLQRTGTTLLQRLLSADPRHHALHAWRALNPAPPLAGDDTRIRQAKLAERGAAWLAPDFFAVHPIEHASVDEDILLLDGSFLSTVAEATLHVPSFSAWLEGQDQTPGYALHKRYLQLMQWRQPGERWVLKTPHHLEWLDTLLAVYPDAHILHTHRDPLETLPSFCSMIAHGRGIMSDAVDPMEIGEHWLRKTHRMVSRTMQLRRARPDVRVHDVYYADLVADPIATVARIYDGLGLELTDAARDAIDRQRRASRKHKYGKHVYAAADFGLSNDRIADRFSAYRSTHGLG
jgi:hypothetical protein